MKKIPAFFLILVALACAYQLEQYRDFQRHSAWMQASDGPPPWLRPLILEAARRYDLDECLIAGIVRQESAYQLRARSICGAQGLMLLMPETALELGITDSFDARQNIMGGTRLFRQYLDRFQGQLVFAVAAFNAGPESVEKYRGVPPYPETQDYVAQVMQNYYQFSWRRARR